MMLELDFYYDAVPAMPSLLFPLHFTFSAIQMVSAICWHFNILAMNICSLFLNGSASVSNWIISFSQRLSFALGVFLCGWLPVFQLVSQQIKSELY